MKPYLLLDVDGPLNPYAKRYDPNGGLVRMFLDPVKWEFSDEKSRSSIPVLLNPDHGGMLKRLSEYYVLTWATMWEDLANTLLAPFYGIEPLPYVTWTENNAVKCMTRRLSQKTLDIEAYMLKKDAPFVWVDDEAFKRDERLLRESLDATVLTINPKRGLTPDDEDHLVELARQHLDR